MYKADLQEKIQLHRNFTLRVAIAAVFALLFIGILIGRAAFLQISQHDKYALKSEKNRIQSQAVPPIRGLIYDAQGKVLASNRPSFSLNIINDSHFLTDEKLEEINQYIPLSHDEIYSFKNSLKKQRFKPGSLIPLKNNLTDKDLAIISLNKYKIPGIAINSQLIRHYPYNELTAHVVGYVNRINKKDLQKIDNNNYKKTHFIGRTGLEQQYETTLHGKTGFQQVEIDVRNRITRALTQKPQDNGEDLYLHLDIELQKLAMQLLGDYRGSIVAINTTNGGVLTFASNPSYNPNDFVTGISHSLYNSYLKDIDKPLINRSLRGLYPPASTIKPAMGLALLNNNTVDWQTSIIDKGYFHVENNPRIYRDWKRGGHGTVDLSLAIAQSCDTYFYTQSVKTGIDKLAPFLSKFGLGKKTGIDLHGEKSGLLPSREWKMARYKQAWYPGDTINFSIGQGYLNITPLQLAYFTSIIANKGIAYRPQLLKHTNNSQNQPAPSRKISLKTPEHWDKIHAAMKDVVHADYGTARRLGYSHKGDYFIAGKSGTAQVKGIPQQEKLILAASEIKERHRDHALFIAFAPIKDPKIAVAVVIENGIGGSSVAGPMAKTIIEYYLDSDGVVRFTEEPQAQPTEQSVNQAQPL